MFYSRRFIPILALLFSILLLSTGLALAQTERNHISLSRLTIVPGSNGTLTLNLVNQDSVAEGEFFITYTTANGLTLGNVQPTTRLDDFNFTVNQTVDGSQVIIHGAFNSLNGATITPSDGSLVTIEYSLSQSATVETALTISQTVLSDSGGTALPVSRSDGLVTVASSIQPDNGGFEAGTTTPWENFGADISLSNDSRTGDSSLQITVRNDQTTGSVGQTITGFNSGEQVCIRAWVKGTVGSDTALKLYAHNGDNFGNSHNPYLFYFPFADQWSELILPYSVDSTGNLRVAFAVLGDDTVYLDDVAISTDCTKIYPTNSYNGDFADGAGGVYQDSTGPITLDTGRDGTFSLKSTQTLTTGQSPAWRGIRQYFQVTGGEVYDFFVWAKWKDVAEGHVKVKWLDGNGEEISQASYVIAEDGSSNIWTKRGGRVLAPVNAVAAELFVWHGVTAKQNLTGSTVWIDEIVFVPSDCPDYIICNTDFEQGFDAWSFYGTQSEVVADSSFNGSIALRSEQAYTSVYTTSWSGIGQTVWVNPSQTYSISVHLKRQDVTQAHVKVEFWNGDQYLYDEYLMTGTDGSSDGWEVQGGLVTAPANATKAKFFILHGVENGSINVPSGIMWIDNVTFMPYNAFDCTTQSQIPQTECKALVTLYNSTNGTNWINKTNWLETAEPCGWHGVICNNGHVTSLDLHSNQLAGPIPPEVGNLTELDHLILYDNPITGSIPPELGNLNKLFLLDWHHTQISGSIPPELGNLVNLEYLFVYHNQNLTGPIPDGLGSLIKLKDLHLYHNNLTGNIPSTLGNLGQLEYLHLENNQLNGSIPSELKGLSSLQELWIHHNNLSDAIPPQLGNLTNLKRLHVDFNELSGQIPSELGNLGQLISLNLAYNNLVGALPTQLSNLNNLTTFHFDGTGICIPNNHAFQLWLSSVPNLFGRNVICQKQEIDSTGHISVGLWYSQTNPLDITLNGSLLVENNIFAPTHIQLTDNSLVWEESDLLTKVGQVIDDPDALDGKARQALVADGVGHGGYGPYIPPSISLNQNYCAEFRLKVADNTINEVVVKLDVVNYPEQEDLQERLLAEHELTGLDFDKPNQYQIFCLDFTNTYTDGAGVELRWYATGKTDVTFDRVTIYHAPQPYTTVLTYSTPSLQTPQWVGTKFVFEDTYQSKLYTDTVLLQNSSGLYINKTASSQTTQPDETLTFQIVMTTPDGTLPITLTDSLPAGLSYVENSLTFTGLTPDTIPQSVCSFSGNELVCRGNIATEALISYQAKVNSNLAKGSILHNNAVVTWPGWWNHDSATVVIPDPEFRDTLLLIYASMDNNLWEYGLELLNRAEKGAGNPFAKTLLVIDGPASDDAYLYRLEEDLDNIHCPTYYNNTCNGRYELGQNMWQWDEYMGTSHSLTAFLEAVQWAYPNAHNVDQLALVLAGHGNGLSHDIYAIGQPAKASGQPAKASGQPAKASGQPAKASGQPIGLLLDENPIRMALSVRDLGAALHEFHQITGDKIGLLYLDSCLMAMSEVAHEISGSVEYLLASQNWSWSIFPYDAHLTAIDGKMTPREIGEAWFANEQQVLEAGNYPYTLSLIDLSQMDTIIAAIDTVARDLEIRMAYQGASKVATARQASSCFDSNLDGLIDDQDSYCDIVSFAQALQVQFAANDVTVTALDSLITAVEGAVIKESHQNGIPFYYNESIWEWDSLGGLSIYVPVLTDEWQRTYYNPDHFSLTADTHWDEFLNEYWTRNDENYQPPPAPECQDEACELPSGPIPEPDMLLNLDTTEDGLYIQWTPMTGQSYTLFRQVVGVTDWQSISQSLTDSSSFEDTNLVENQFVCYQLQSDDGTQQSNIVCEQYGQFNLIVPHQFEAANEVGLTTVNFVNATGQCLEAVGIVLNYDPTVVSPTGKIYPTIHTQNYQFEANTSNLGEVRIGAVNGNCIPLYGSGGLFRFEYKVVGQEGDVTPFTLIEETVLYDTADLKNPLLTNKTDGSLTIHGSCMMGDVTCDGRIDPADAAQALRIAVSKIIPTFAQDAACDVSGDGVCAAADATLILCYFAFQDWNSCGGVSTPAPRLLARQVESPILLELSQLVQSEDKASLWIRLSNGNEIAGGDFTFSYDTDHLTAEAVHLTNLTNNFNHAVNLETPGQIYFSLAQREAIGAEGELFRIEFTVQKEEFEEVKLTQIRLNDETGRDLATNLQQEIQIGTYQRSNKNEVYIPMFFKE